MFCRGKEISGIKMTCAVPARPEGNANSAGVPAMTSTTITPMLLGGVVNPVDRIRGSGHDGIEAECHVGGV
jgi:hypothetical protein